MNPQPQYTKKVLRRKPPPPLEDSPAPVPEFNVPVQQRLSPKRSVPQLEVHPHYQDESFDWNEDSLLSYESPRPMGPKELTLENEYSYYADQDSEVQDTLGSLDEHSAYNYSNNSPQSSDIDMLLLLSLMPYPSSQYPPSPQSTQPTPISTSEPQFIPKRKSFPSRKYQNLLHKSTLFTPAENGSTDQPQVMLSEPEQRLPVSLPPRPSREALLATKGDTSHVIPPYPTNDLFEWSDPEKDSTPYIELKRPITGTPNRIPTLTENSLAVDESFNDSRFYSPHGSPNDTSFDILNGDVRRSRTTASLPLSSPSRSPLRSRSFAPNHLSAYSRSPSPHKSPFNTSPFSSKGLPTFLAHYLHDLVFDEDLSSPDERIPKWNLLDHDPFELEDYFPPYTPATGRFDFSILPELPNPADTELNLPQESPDGLSSAKTNDLKLSIKRKKDTLPPVPLDLPRLPFLSSFLNNQHFMECQCVWSLQSILGWLRKLNSWLHDSAILKKELKKALIKLLVFHKQNLPLTLIGRNASQIIESLIHQNGLAIEESTEPGGFLKVNEHALVSGVLVELTDCYCDSTDHQSEDDYGKMINCYSSQCHINKGIEHSKMMSHASVGDIVLGNDWATHWQLSAEDMTFEPVVIKRQSFLFDLLIFEQKFIQRAECFVEIAGPAFIKTSMTMASSSIMTSLTKFKKDVLESAKDMLEIHRTTLMKPLLKHLISEGIIINDVVSIARLYLNWSKEAKEPLLRYMSVVPIIEDILQNSLLKRWDEQLGSNPTIRELKVNGTMLLLSTFNSRYQQLPLQLSDIRKTFPEGEPEHEELTKAIDSIKKLGTKVNQMKVHADNAHALRRIEKQLSWKPSIQQPNINFLSNNRKFFYRGNLTKKGDLKINNHSVHLIVLDNYLLITEKSKSQKATGYRVTEQPIPIDFLILENRERDLGTFTTIPILTNQPANNQNNTENEEDSTFPFKIRHAGRGKSQSYTFYATSESEKQAWLTGFLQAKTNLLRKVKPLAPYDTKGIENAFYAYDFHDRCLKLPMTCEEDPLWMLSRDTNLLLKQRGVKSDIYSPNSANDALTFGRVQCCEVFTFKSVQFYLVGVSSGIYCSDLKNRWKRLFNNTNPTKITVLPELNVIIILANKQLKYYSLPRVINIYYEKKEPLTSTLLSNSQILFYEIGRHRGTLMLFLAKKKTAGTTSFKVFTIETDNSGVFNSFALLKRFYIQSECYGISIFNTTFAVHTTRGFEVLDLQRLQPRTVPEIPASEVSSKKFDGYNRKNQAQGPEALKRLISHSGARPMGMFKLNNNKEFLLVYNDCAAFVNKAGRLSRTSFLRFDFRPKTISFLDNSLFIVGDEVIEVWSISDLANGTNKLHQVITGKDISMINTEKRYFVTANPIKVGLQLVFYMEPRGI